MGAKGLPTNLSDLGLALPAAALGSLLVTDDQGGTMGDTTQPAAGWYGQADGRERRWDGATWTDEYRDPAPVGAPAEATEAPPAPEKEKPKATNGGNALAAIIVLAVIFFGFKACSGSSSTSDETDALVNCRRAVKAQIKNPATADFDVFSTNQTASLITGEVTAENDFGATKSLRYSCRMIGSTVQSATVTGL